MYLWDAKIVLRKPAFLKYEIDNYFANLQTYNSSQTEQAYKKGLP